MTLLVSCFVLCAVIIITTFFCFREKWRIEFVKNVFLLLCVNNIFIREISMPSALFELNETHSVIVYYTCEVYVKKIKQLYSIVRRFLTCDNCVRDKFHEILSFYLAGVLGAILRCWKTISFNKNELKTKFTQVKLLI